MALPTNKFAYLGLVFVFVLLWSSAFAASKIALQVGPPMLLLGMRFFLAGVLMIGFAIITKTYRPVGARNWGKLIALGLLNQAGYQGIAWLAMGTVSSALTAVVISMNPILITLLAVPMLGEHMSVRRLLGLGVGVVGVVIVLNSRITVTGEDVTGTVMVAFALFSMVFGSVLFKYWKMDMPLSMSIGGQFLAAGVFLFAIGLVSEDLASIIWGLKLALVMTYLVIGVTVGGIGLWFYLLTHGHASDASALHFLMPPFGLMFGWVLLNEPVVAGDLVGIIPIALGIWLATHKRKSKASP